MEAWRLEILGSKLLCDLKIQVRALIHQKLVLILIHTQIVLVVSEKGN